MKNWKTTTLGVLTIAGAVIGAAVAYLNGTEVDWAAVSAAVMAGAGLIAAKDSNVTGGTKQQ